MPTGGSSPSGTTTVNQVNSNPVANAQLPNLQDLWGRAAGVAGSDYENSLWQQLSNQAQTGANLTAGGAVLTPQAQSGVQQVMNAGNPTESQSASLMGLGPQAIGNAANYGNQVQNLSSYLSGNIPGMASGISGAGANAAGYGNTAVQVAENLAPYAYGAGAPASQRLMDLSGQSIYQNPIFNSGVTGIASGAYINPQSNPALAGTIQSATQPLVNAYQTATAPQTDSNFEGAGRYGSGAMANARSQNQYNLGQALGNATSNIVNNAYNTGLGATLGAGSALGSAYNTGVANAGTLAAGSGALGQSDVNNAANIANTGYSLGGQLQLGQGSLGASAGNLLTSGLGNAGNLLNNAGTMTTAPYNTAGTAYSNAGNLNTSGLNSLLAAYGMAPSLANSSESQLSAAINAPYANLQNYAGILGVPQGGTGSQATTSPYFTNPTANILGAGLGGLSLANGIGGANGLFPGALSSLFGGGAAAGFPAAGTIGASFGDSLLNFLPAAAAV